MRLRDVLTAALLIAALAPMFGGAAHASGDLDGLSITMDGDSYNIGATGGICYTVPGPGQVTLTNNNLAGTITLLSRRDDGSGSCEHGPIQGPAGRYCVVILFSGAAGVGTAQICYQVFDAASTS